MAIVFGTRSYGKVDKIADICHVATQFFHVQYVPLLPLRSYVVLEETGDEFRGVQIPLSFKSIFVSYLRAALFLGTFVIPFCMLIQFEQHPQKPLFIGLGIFLGVVSLALFFGTYYLSWIAKAGYHRAVKIGQLVPFNDQTRLMIEVLYGQLTADQADRELARLESQEAERLETGYDGGGSASI